MEAETGGGFVADVRLEGSLEVRRMRVARAAVQHRVGSERGAPRAPSPAAPLALAPAWRRRRVRGHNAAAACSTQTLSRATAPPRGAGVQRSAVAPPAGALRV